MGLDERSSLNSYFFRQSGNPVKVWRENGLALPGAYRVAGSALLAVLATLGLASAHPAFLPPKKETRQGRRTIARTISPAARSVGSKPRALTHWKSVWNKA